MKNILVPIDFKGNEDLLIDKAYELGDNFQSKVWFIHVAAPDPDFVGYDAGPQFIRDNRADKLREEHKKLESITNSLKQKGVNSEALLIQGATVETILNKTKKLNIDLIIIGHQSYGIFYQALFGSVSESLIKKSNIPVLVVPLD
ncbi:universal stress protein [Winogradskyella vincentii]|uniref:Universal stress protein n=1 Tax=Winogradskyella vincentii TaxID=2877122 RepID=A0ABS7XYF1_9FLAO|nr:universal stress protein [Winogradskyella vincentii]MCA0152671.1 universal stress protein [Winogradskyella vincentii]